MDGLLRDCGVAANGRRAAADVAVHGNITAEVVDRVIASDSAKFAHACNGDTTEGKRAAKGAWARGVDQAGIATDQGALDVAAGAFVARCRRRVEESRLSAAHRLR